MPKEPLQGAVSICLVGEAPMQIGSIEQGAALGHALLDDIKVEDEEGEGRIKLPTRLMTNSWEIARAL